MENTSVRPKPPSHSADPLDILPRGRSTEYIGTDTYMSTYLWERGSRKMNTPPNTPSEDVQFQGQSRDNPPQPDAMGLLKEQWLI